MEGEMVEVVIVVVKEEEVVVLGGEGGCGRGDTDERDDGEMVSNEN
jgi:hypothetical protein